MSLIGHEMKKRKCCIAYVCMQARYERDLSAAQAAAKEALDTLQSRLETKHQEERDEWER